jgi:hypothetical protein
VIEERLLDFQFAQLLGRFLVSLSPLPPLLPSPLLSLTAFIVLPTAPHGLAATLLILQ